MAKEKIVTQQDGSFYGIRFDCPGCALVPDRGSKAVILPVDWTPPGLVRFPSEVKPWGFNGDLEKPTFTPSVLSHWEEWQGEGVPPKHNICHSFVRDGQIQFLGDCTHTLAGQTVDLPELDE